MIEMEKMKKLREKKNLIHLSQAKAERMSVHLPPCRNSLPGRNQNPNQPISHGEKSGYHLEPGRRSHHHLLRLAVLLRRC